MVYAYIVYVNVVCIVKKCNINEDGGREQQGARMKAPIDSHEWVFPLFQNKNKKSVTMTMNHDIMNHDLWRYRNF